MHKEFAEEVPKPEKPKGCFGCRHTFALMAFLGLAVVYLTRSNLSVAIVDMITSNSTAMTNDASSPTSEANNSGASCPYEDDIISGVDDDKGEFHWNSKQKGLILSSFFWSFVFTQVPGGILAEKCGGKWIVAIGVLLSSVFSLLTPLAARLGGPGALIAVRIIMGLFQGVTFPATVSMVAKWVPSAERTTIGAFVMAGGIFGTIVSFPLAGWLCDLDFDNGWPLAFYVPGAIGILWFTGWIFLVYDNPSAHPRITENEKKFILASSGKSANRGLSSTPWRSIMTSIHMWAILIAHFGQSWGFAMLISQLPSYMKGVLHFDIKANGALSAMPYVFMWIFSLMFSPVADVLRRKQILSTTAVRKLFTTIALSLPAFGLIGVIFTGCDRVATVALLSLSAGFTGAMNSGFLVNHMDIASNFAGTMMGITNTVATSCGFIVPIVVGVTVVNEESLSDWQMIFFLSAGINIVANVFYVAFGTGVEQPWNRLDDNEEQAQHQMNLKPETISLLDKLK